MEQGDSSLDDLATAAATLRPANRTSQYPVARRQKRAISSQQRIIWISVPVVTTLVIVILTSASTRHPYSIDEFFQYYKKNGTRVDGETVDVSGVVVGRCWLIEEGDRDPLVPQSRFDYTEAVLAEDHGKRVYLALDLGRKKGDPNPPDNAVRCIIQAPRVSDPAYEKAMKLTGGDRVVVRGKIGIKDCGWAIRELLDAQIVNMESRE